MKPTIHLSSVITIGFALASLAGGCAGNGVDPEAQGATGESAQAVIVDVNAHAVAYEYADLANMPHGIAADSRLVFVTELLNQRVAVLDRFTGREVASVPAPPGGFLLPFAARVPRDGHLVLLDSGGFPSPTAPSIARVYDYNYTYNEFTHAFHATLSRSVIFNDLPVVFAEDVEVLPDGTELVSESIIGAIWVVAPNGTISPGLLPASLAPGEGIPQLAPCFLPDTTVNGVPFHSAGNFGPGVVALAARHGQLYFSSTCQGGVYGIPVASITDPTRTPDERAADIRSVSPRPAGVAVESFEGLAFNPFDPDDNRLYCADSFHLSILRVNVTTGARETLLTDSRLLNFPTGIQFGPPVLGLTPLFVASDQEYRLASINAAITSDELDPPFILTKVYVNQR